MEIDGCIRQLQNASLHARCLRERSLRWSLPVKERALPEPASECLRPTGENVAVNVNERLQHLSDRPTMARSGVGEPLW